MSNPLTRTTTIELLSAVHRHTGQTIPALDKTLATLRSQRVGSPERAVRLIRAAVSMFSGNVSKAVDWLHSPADLLSGSKPIDAIWSEIETNKIVTLIDECKLER